MRRTLGVLAAAAVVLFLLPAGASARGFSYGVTAAEITPTSALLWTRADTPGKLVVQVSADRRFDRGDVELSGDAKASDDNTVRIKAGRLAPGSQYYYRFLQGSNTSSAGRFSTAPAAKQSKTIEFAYSGDADASAAPGLSAPFYNTFQVYKQMAREGNDFNINFGDTIYSDSDIAGLPPALTVADKWAKYKANLALKNLQTVRAATGMYNHWDDHEFINDFTAGEHGPEIYQAGVDAFQDYMPVTYKPSTGIYRTVRWGKTAELFFLDERSFRSPKASADHVCDNPDTGVPDLAPTAPPNKRSLFAALIPSLARPVSQACLDTIGDPNRTMLGSSQLQRFKAAVDKSTATWKIIMNEVPIQQFYGLPYDRWEGYAAERLDVLRHVKAKVKNAVFLSTDTHANFYNDARLSTFAEEGGTVNTGINEMVTGPVATLSFAREIDRAVSREGAGDLLVSVFFKPPPPDGVGMPCASSDVFSYTQVKVTPKALTLTPKDLNGRPVREKGANNQPGRTCGPFTIKAK